MFNKFNYLSGLFLCIFSLNAHAADLNLIREFKETSEKFSRYSIELTQQVSNLQIAKKCESVPFDQKFEKVFKSNNIKFRIKSTVLDKVLLVSKCIDDSGEAYVINKTFGESNVLNLIGLIKSYQISSAAWMDLYKSALLTTSKTNPEAKKELLKFQKEEQAKIELLQRKFEKAKGSHESLKKFVFSTILVIGYVALFVSVGSIAIPTLLTVFGIQNALAGMTAVYFAATIGVAISGAAAGNYGSDKVRQIEEAKIERQQIQSEIAERREVLKSSQRYINAIEDQDNTNPINQIY